MPTGRALSEAHQSVSDEPHLGGVVTATIKRLHGEFTGGDSTVSPKNGSPARHVVSGCPLGSVEKLGMGWDLHVGQPGAFGAHCLVVVMPKADGDRDNNPHGEIASASQLRDIRTRQRR